MSDAATTWTISTPGAQAAIDAFANLDKAQQKAVLSSLELDKASQKAKGAHAEHGKLAEALTVNYKELASEMIKVTSVTGALLAVFEGAKRGYELVQEARKEALTDAQRGGEADKSLLQATAGRPGIYRELREARETFRGQTGSDVEPSTKLIADLYQRHQLADLPAYTQLAKLLPANADLSGYSQAVAGYRTAGGTGDTASILGKLYTAGPAALSALGGGLIDRRTGRDLDQSLAIGKTIAPALGSEAGGGAEALTRLLLKAHKGQGDIMAVVEQWAALSDEQLLARLGGKGGAAQKAFNALRGNLPAYQENLALIQQGGDAITTAQDTRTPLQQQAEITAEATARAAQKKEAMIAPGESAKKAYQALVEEHDRELGRGTVSTWIDTTLAGSGMLDFSGQGASQRVRQLAQHMSEASSVSVDAYGNTLKMSPEVAAGLQSLIRSIDQLTKKLDANSQATHTNTAATAGATAPVPRDHEPPGGP